MAVFSRIDDLIGQTPLLKLTRLKNALCLEAELYAKLECFNPFGSVKDRTVKSMLKGVKSGQTVIEATSGSTGVALAALGGLLGMQIVIVMPQSAPIFRQELVKSYGAELILTDKTKGMQGAIEKVSELLETRKNACSLRQFENPLNPQAHEKTGEEIFSDLEGSVDVFVAGVGTGGTFTGISRYLKSRKPQVKTVAVEPKKSPVLSGGEKGEHGLHGIGAGFIPKTLDLSQIDEVARVSEEEARCTQKQLLETEGVLCGISSGAACFAAIAEAKKSQNKGKNVVVLFPSGK